MQALSTKGGLYPFRFLMLPYEGLGTWIHRLKRGSFPSALATSETATSALETNGWAWIESVTRSHCLHLGVTNVHYCCGVESSFPLS